MSLDNIKLSMDMKTSTPTIEVKGDRLFLRIPGHSAELVRKPIH